MKTLIIIDFQKDFTKKEGSLYVKGSEEAEEGIINYINQNHKEITEVVFTVDWHPLNHCSFKENGGIWPIHCVQFSEGAGISDRIVRICQQYGLSVKIFRKGELAQEEEYGAFVSGLLNSDKGEFTFYSSTGRDEDSVVFETLDWVVCGVAGDYCVKETLANLINNNNQESKVSVLMSGIASIDGGETLEKYLEEHRDKIEKI